ncbi:tubulin polyglutamylase TTLL6 isoform X2 [Eurytemora carolleeae]|nr:tubulin polyglutamylase TTLL6 isoform X2 [Eurytemora carolleeae]XP_023319535.1 tubulin polyglutamylase TTLL6 isoform X2 [Eurytemora carolleeae]|eukprot:XP_023319534.1 tubulin polyglutamylase TTLL6-like isoform X2 [Eurytemora affinis]
MEDSFLLRVFGRGRFSSLIFSVLVLGLVITALNIWQLSSLQAQHYLQEHGTPEGQPDPENGQTYVVYARHPDTGYLQHVYNVLDRAGYRRGSYNTSSDWDLMWAHDYPFKKIKDKMLAMKKGQRINKFPGSGFITNKVNLATSGIKNVPPAFSIPGEKGQLLKYARRFPDKLFVQKSNNHRGIQIQGLSDLDLTTEGSFVQEYISNPFLVDGYKFDIGIYTTLTSIDPLRIYVHHSDALLRFCPEKYHPFDARNKNKYVVQDDYLPSWKIPSFSKYMKELGFSFTDTLNTYIRGLGKDPANMWEEMYSTIAEVYLKHEEMFIKAMSHYPHKEAFFEMVRFDFVLDENLNVFLMEANMSPNLSSAHFPANKLLYEQVIHSVLKLVGVVQGSIRWDLLHPAGNAANDMVVANKDVMTFPELCSSPQCQETSSCNLENCDLCLKCLKESDLDMLKAAWKEQVNRHATRRIFPVPPSRVNSTQVRGTLSKSNWKMQRWFQGKCNMDINWCS